MITDKPNTEHSNGTNTLLPAVAPTHELSTDSDALDAGGLSGIAIGATSKPVLNILVACEESQAVTIELRNLGHKAYSCDLLPCSGGHPEWHIRRDVTQLLRRNSVGIIKFSTHNSWDVEQIFNWDLVIAFPPCTDLAVSGARYFEQKRLNGSQAKSIEFFMQFTRLKIPFAIENPIGIMSTLYRKPNQIIQPWQFGHGETKATCLWLNNLPNLIPTDIVEGREQRVWKMPPSKDRAKLRSKTYSGIARAMAEQWTQHLINKNYGIGKQES